MKKKLQMIKEDPNFQKSLQKIKPMKSLWGVLGVIVFFFLPEVLVVYWSEEMLAWINVFLQDKPQNQMTSLLRWLGEQVFTGRVGFLNIGFGLVLLLWIFWDDIKNIKEKRDIS